MGPLKLRKCNTFAYMRCNSSRAIWDNATFSAAMDGHIRIENSSLLEDVKYHEPSDLGFNHNLVTSVASLLVTFSINSGH